MGNTISFSSPDIQDLSGQILNYGFEPANTNSFGVRATFSTAGASTVTGITPVLFYPTTLAADPSSSAFGTVTCSPITAAPGPDAATTQSLLCDYPNSAFLNGRQAIITFYGQSAGFTQNYQGAYTFSIDTTAGQYSESAFTTVTVAPNDAFFLPTVTETVTITKSETTRVGTTPTSTSFSDCPVTSSTTTTSSTVSSTSTSSITTTSSASTTGSSSSSTSSTSSGTSTGSSSSTSTSTVSTSSQTSSGTTSSSSSTVSINPGSSSTTSSSSGTNSITSVSSTSKDTSTSSSVTSATTKSGEITVIITKTRTVCPCDSPTPTAWNNYKRDAGYGGPSATFTVRVQTTTTTTTITETAVEGTATVTATETLLDPSTFTATVVVGPNPTITVCTGSGSSTTTTSEVAAST